MISIIITCFNEDRIFLPESIRSCTRQGGETEIVLVDGGSYGPPAPSIMDEIYSRCSMFISTYENIRQAESINLGIKNAKGEFIIILDADDTLIPYAIDAMVDTIGDDTVVYGNIQMSDSIYHTPPKITKEVLLSYNPIGLTSLFRKSAWEKVGGFKEVVYTDYRFWVEMFLSGAHFKYLDQIVYKHNFREGSLTQKYKDRVEELNNEARRPLCAL
jgi:glycosyltransferase involved in cell wall biosynthesis